MFHPFREFAVIRFERLRTRGGERLAGVVLALLVEGLLVLAVLSLGLAQEQAKKPGAALISVAIKSVAEKSPEKPATRPAGARKPVQQPAQPPQPLPTPLLDKPAAAQTPAIIPLSKSQLAAFDIFRIPRRAPATPVPGKAMMGPPDLGVPGDSKRVGSAPNGEPMYAASWYREPYDNELSGYLSTADGPGWALIACRTVADFKVDDCIGIDEYPSGSNIQRAVLAAAWQFKVRPPRVGGISKVGEWVRIRIDYTERRQ